MLDRGEGRETDRKRNINVWLPLVHPLLGTWPAIQACAWLGIELATMFGSQAGAQSAEPHQPELLSFSLWHLWNDKQWYFIKVSHDLDLSICSWLDLCYAFWEELLHEWSACWRHYLRGHSMSLCLIIFYIHFDNMAKGSIHQIFPWKGTFLSLCSYYMIVDEYLRLSKNTLLPNTILSFFEKALVISPWINYSMVVNSDFLSIHWHSTI